MKIVLLGYMGSGKSTIGRRLAKSLNMPFIDLDHYLEEAIGLSIPQIFEQHGELYFRRKEHELLKELLAKETDFVLSLGGGTPCYAGNMDLVLQHTQNVFYLDVSIDELVRRLTRGKQHRPMISHLPDEELPEFIGKHLFERRPFYSQAPHIVKADNKDRDQLASEIHQQLV